MSIEVQREAALSLREPGGIVRVRVSWPPPGSGDGGPVLVFLSDVDSSPEAVDALCRGLCVEAGMLVLSLRTRAFDAATTALEWTADHAHQLGADPTRLLIGGVGTGGGLAAAVAAHARDLGWPPLTRQVLVRPDFSECPVPESLVGVAPATVVGARAYASRLEEAGVEVEERRMGDLVGSLANQPRLLQGV